MLIGGGFNSPGRPVIYAALTFAGAVLEVLVHARIGRVPKTHAWVESTVHDDVSIERHTAKSLPEWWDAPAQQIARRFGDAWLTEARSAILVVPSVVARAEKIQRHSDRTKNLTSCTAPSSQKHDICK
ncbi:RES family NAD+ phosphorylase [Burkholderia ubonensis]|uniref:RES family NAD+ phosphorylase n=1 Tax=Burkholderia ubonensis TaxID=101571 RepID=UPI000AF721F6|nr:RES family NAD+ phosphorylase [Burkholderia ubonensis]